MSSKVQPVNLKERIAALEQRNNASQRPLSPPPTSSNSSFLTPQTTGGALKDKIAKFEKKGGVPVPRGSFGLGAPPTAENASAKRRGELYGNRIPSAVRSHITGPQLSGGVSTQITGPSPPSWADHRHSFALDGKIPGLEYNGNGEDTGGFEPPDSSLGQPQELSFASRTSSPPPVPTLSDPPVAEKVQIERRVASDSVRRGITFATALELARKAETDKQAVYDPRSREESLSPVHTGSSSTRLSPPLGQEALQNAQETATPSVIVTGGAEVEGSESILKDDKEVEYNNEIDHVHAQNRQKEQVITPSEVSSSEVEIERSSSTTAVLDEIPQESPSSDSQQSQSVIISLTTPEETSKPETHSGNLDASTGSEVSPVSPKRLPSTPKAIDEVPAKSGTEKAHTIAESSISPPITPISPVSAELKAGVSAKQVEKLLQEDAPSETRSPTSTSQALNEATPSPVSPSVSPTISGNESDSGASTGSTSTVRDTRSLKHDDEDDDADLFVKPIKRRSPMKDTFEEKPFGKGSGDDAAHTLPPKDPSVDQSRLAPSTPSKSTPIATTPSEETQASSQSSAVRDSFTSQVSQTITMSSRPESLMDSSSPGHVSFAQKISPATSRGIPIFIPASSGRQTPGAKTPITPTPPPLATTSTPPAVVEPQQNQKRNDRDDAEDTGASEFGVVTTGGSSTRPSHLRAQTDTDSQKIHNRASTFSAVVHRKVRETQTLPASSKRAPSTPTKTQQGLAAEPTSPGLNELSLLMQQSALLESRLMNGDYPDENQEKRGVGSREKERETENKEREKEKVDVEGVKLKRTNTMNSGKSQDSEGKKRKLSLKRTFGMGKNSRREASLPLESIPATPPPPLPGAGTKDMSRSKSMDALRSTQQTATLPPVPSFSLEPPPLPKQKARSIHALPTEPKNTETAASSTTSSTASTSSTSGTGMDSDDVPPTPPPKSPPGKYLSSIRRFASSSRSHAGTSSRSSVSNSSELSSDDSVTVVTPPDYSPNLTGSRTLLETRTRTRSGSRSGKTILVGGAGTPPPTGVVEEDRASVFTSSSGSVRWPSASSPKKGGGISRAASFAEKVFSRSRTKSSTSSVNSYDPSDRYINEQTMSRAHPPSSMPALPPDVLNPSPSLHELILSEPLHLSIPEVSEPHSPSQKSTPTHARPPSWLSTSSAGTGSSSAYSRLLDKDFFDSFPAVPETLPPNHSRANSQNTIRTLDHSPRPH